MRSSPTPGATPINNHKYEGIQSRPQGAAAARESELGVGVCGTYRGDDVDADTRDLARNRTHTPVRHFRVFGTDLKDRNHAVEILPASSTSFSRS